MTSVKRPTGVLLCGAFLFVQPGCAGPPRRGGTAVDAPAAAKSEPEKDAAPKEKEKRELELKRGKLVRDLVIAKEEAGKATAAVDLQQLSSNEAVERAQVERDLVEQKLRDLAEKLAPVRLDRSRLDLQAAKDYFKESEEELAQLEMMYKENDLADKTREIVIIRAKRRMERAKRDLTLREQELSNLEKATLPTETKDLQSQLLQKRQTSESAKRQVEADLRGKRIERMKAEAEVARMEAELAALDKELVQ